MENVAVCKAKDIEAAARQWLQGLLGRELNEEEEITILAFPPHPAPSEGIRRAVGERLDRILDKAANNMKDIPDSEFEAAVDEAFEHVRRRE